MKKNIKVIPLMLAFVIMLLLPGCSVRKPVSAANFKKEAEKEGFTVSEKTSSDVGAESYLIASKKGSDTKIVYLSFGSASSAHDGYTAAIGDLIPSGGKNVVDSDTYNKYTVSKGELYYAVTRMDDTVIYCSAVTSQKDEADNFMKAVNY